MKEYFYRHNRLIFWALMNENWVKFPWILPQEGNVQAGGACRQANGERKQSERNFLSDRIYMRYKVIKAAEKKMER